MRSLRFGAGEIFTAATLHGLIAESIGTFFFVFIGCGSVISTGLLDEKFDSPRLLVIAFAHGFAVVVLAASTSGVSGGHLNPAVSFGFVISGHMSIFKGLLYCVAQIGGASLGAGFYRRFPSVVSGHYGPYGAHLVNPSIKVSEAFGMEVLLTFLLVYVIFGTAVDKKGPSTIAPLASGMAVLVDHLVGVPITGASMNPARTLGAAIWSGQWQNHWLYWGGPIVGASGAAVVYTLLFLPSQRVADDQEKLLNRVPV